MGVLLNGEALMFSCEVLSLGQKVSGLPDTVPSVVADSIHNRVSICGPLLAS